MVTGDSHNFSWEGMMSLPIRYSPIFDFLSSSIHRRSSDIYRTDVTFSNLCVITTNYTLYP